MHSGALTQRMVEFEVDSVSSFLKAWLAATMVIVMLVPKTVSVKELRRQLEDLGDKLNCDVDIDPA